MLRSLKIRLAATSICILASLQAVFSLPEKNIEASAESRAEQHKGRGGASPPGYATALLNLESDRAIRLLCTALNQSLFCKDYILASRIMRMIALAFRIDENDRAAAQAIQIALKLNPADEYCRFQAAEYLFRDGNWQDAEKLLQELSKSTNPGVVLRAEAFLNQQRGSVAQSIELLEKCIETNPGDQRALLKLSYLYLIDEDNAEAAAVQRKLSALSQSAYLKEIYLGRADEAEGKMQTADTHYQAAGRINKGDPLWHCQLAQMYMKTHKLKEADREFRQCFACQRMLSLAYTNWSIMEAFFGNKKNSENCLDYALALRPHSSELYFARGIVDEKSGKLDKSVEEFSKAVALNPHNGSPYWHLLKLYEATKSSQEKRLDLCRTWSSSCPHSAAAGIELANALRKSGNDNEALKNYLRVEDLMKGRSPSDKDLRLMLCTMHANIAAILYKRKDQKGALAEACQFNSSRPPQASTAGLSLRPAVIDTSKLAGKAREAAEHALLADALYECRQLNEAEEEYRQALKSDPDNISYHSCLLKVLLDKKDYAAAAKEDAAVSNHIITHIPDLFDSGKQNKPASP